jgi:hypothetical protein
MAWSRMMVLVWTSLWMLAAPFVHIHPEADHRHGAEGHKHGGTVHTIFSPDLPCEFSVYNHASVAEDESRCPLHLIAHPSHGAKHLEIDLVLASSASSQVGKGTALDVAAHSFHPNPPARLHAARQVQSSPSLTNLFLTASLSSRAPPLV